MTRLLVSALLALALACGGARTPAQTAWTRLDGPFDTTGLRVVDEGSSRLEARGAALIRSNGADTTTLRELPNRPTGRIAALARDPHGGTFIAAEHGIFLAHPSVDTVDRLDLSDGVPPGEPVGIVLDAQRRLWVATRTHFGVVHTGFFYGRTHTAADGLPPGPYTGLASHPDGGLILSTNDGAWRYRPDRGAPPTVTSVAIDGDTHNGTAALARTWPVAIQVEANGSGTGGATLRWVVDGHHNWQALEAGGEKVVDMNPGKRKIHVVALDRDLRRSNEVVVPLSVAYPMWLRPLYLLGGVVLGIVLTLVWLLRRARHAGGGSIRIGKAVLSTAILWWLILQLTAGVFPHARGWPFCGFSMYTGTTKENAVGGAVSLMRIDAQGQQHGADLRRFDLVLDTHWQVLRPFMNGDVAFRRSMLERYNAHRSRRHPERVPGPATMAAALRVVHTRTRLTREGKIPVAPLVMAVVEKRP